MFDLMFQSMEQGKSGTPKRRLMENLKISSFLTSECQSMDRLVRVLTKLEDVTGKEPIQLPHIVAVGDQSSGKSSVVEGIVGKSFLPRGVGVVTRRPILIRLERCSPEEGDHAIFTHDPKVHNNFSEVRQEIVRETERAAGTNHGICSQPIALTIYSKNIAFNLTLVDLPGLIKVPMGDQPQDIEEMLRGMILNYITNPNSIILAIVTANTDVATSESLKISKEADPTGDRTLAVVTKLDIMDEGTDATEILSGKIASAKLGVVGVVNRSQRDNAQGVSLKEAALQEMKFFYERYQQLANKHGTSYLARILQEVLNGHVKSRLPHLKAQVEGALAVHKATVSSLKWTELSSPNEYLLKSLTKFAKTFCSKILGTSSELGIKELEGGARISYIFHEALSSALKSIDPLSCYSRSAILTAIRNSSGINPGLFMPESCFENLVKEQISRLEPPALGCVQLVFEEMEKILYSCFQGKDLARFPKLCQRIAEIVTGLLKERLSATNLLVKTLIEIQGAYINTAHPDFMPHVIRREENQVVPLVETEHPREELLPLEVLVIRYFDIVKKTIQDAVPKAIMHCLVNNCMEHILEELLTNIYDPGKVAEYLEESSSIAQKREYANDMVKKLEEADSVLIAIKEGHSFF